MTGVATLPVVEVRALTKRYGAHTVFEAVDLTVRAGEIVAIVGESGVGKSTLLNCIAGLDAADSGDVRVMGEAVARLPEAEQARLRRRHIGFVFQAFHVLPHLTVAQNVALPLLLLGGGDDRERVQRALAQVGLADLGERLAGAAVGRSVATRGDRARADPPPRAAAGRRAVGQPRPEDGGVCARCAGGAGPRARRGLPAGDPLPGRGRPRRPHPRTHSAGAAASRGRRSASDALRAPAPGRRRIPPQPHAAPIVTAPARPS